MTTKAITRSQLKEMIQEVLEEQNFRQSHKKMFLEKLKGFLVEESRNDYGGIDQYDIDPILNLVEKYIDQNS